MAMQASSSKLKKCLEFKEITPSLRAKLERRKEIYKGRLHIIEQVLKKPTSKEKQRVTRNSEVVQQQ